MDDTGEIVRSEVVATTNGPVRGYRDGGLSIFKGLALYAAPPLGNLRFRPPEPLAAWREPVEALSLGAPAIQASVAQPGRKDWRAQRRRPAPRRASSPGTSEDCLFLNSPGRPVSQAPGR